MTSGPTRVHVEEGCSQYTHSNAANVDAHAGCTIRLRHPHLTTTHVTSSCRVAHSGARHAKHSGDCTLARATGAGVTGTWRRRSTPHSPGAPPWARHHSAPARDSKA